MGIPSYFSHIIRKYPKTVSPVLPKVDNFYVDSNSIIYDAVHRLDPNLPQLEDAIIMAVCQKLDEYLLLVNPTRVILAFDGVPPFAKIKQQRERRYKGLITQKYLKQSSGWNTVQITPGTTFMNKLNTRLTEYFKPHEQKYTYFKLSTSQEPGEGEHKIFEHIRAFPAVHKNTTTMIYGLDADLIVLGLHHLSYGDMYLLRESPAFLLEGDLHVLRLGELAHRIQEIVPSLSDYVLLTLFLGNDFMPHFPALNLRSNGMEILLRCYEKVGLPLYDKGIQWRNVHVFLEEVSRHEFSTICREHAFRSRYVSDVSTDEKRVNNMPMLQRDKEQFINPTRKGWEQRYYATLLPNTDIPSVCKNFVDMLEWNMQYYTSGCVSWSLCYQYTYPPLLCDLKKHIPTEVSLPCDATPWTERQLLNYVLPPVYHQYMEGGVSTETELPQLEWSYCRYLWESHVLFVKV